MRSLPVRLLILAVVGAVLVTAYTLRIRTGMDDFEVYHRTGQRFAAGESLYQTGDGHYMFKYLPSSAAVYLPFAVLPMEAAKALWFALSIAAFAGALVLMLRLMPDVHGFVPVVATLIVGKYLLHELRLGQINTFVMLVSLLVVSALSRSPKADRAAGLWAGLATAIKPYAALFVAYLVVKRRWAAAAIALAATAVAQVVPVIFYGVDGTIGQLKLWRETLSASTPVLLTNSDAISVLAFFTKWLGDPARASVPALIVLAALAALFLAVVMYGGGRQDAVVLEGAMLLTLTPLVSPLGWDYNFLMALPAVMLVLRQWQSFPAAVRILLAVNFAVIALALYDTLGREWYSVFMAWSVTTINFIIVVVALAYLRFTRVR